MKQTPFTQAIPIALIVVLGAAATVRAERTLKHLEHATGKFVYFVVAPDALKGRKDLPVLVYLHGIGSAGATTDVMLQKEGIIRRAERDKQFPFILVAPQASSHWGSNNNIDRAIAALDRVLTDYPCDKDRVYLCGFSAGGFGTVACAKKYPMRFAAISPVAGASDSAAKAVAHIPIWVFHGDADPTVGVGSSRSMVAALARSNATELRYTETPGLAHSTRNAWGKHLWEWLLTHRVSELKRQPMQPRMIDAPNWHNMPLEVRFILDRRGAPSLPPMGSPPAALRSTVSPLRSGRYAEAREKLRALLDAPDTLGEANRRTAEKLIRHIDDHEQRLESQARSLSEHADYGTARFLLETLKRQYRGAESAKRAEETLASWRSDPQMRKEIKAGEMFAKIQKQATSMPGDQAIKTYEGFLKRYGDSKAAELARKEIKKLNKSK